MMSRRFRAVRETPWPVLFAVVALALALTLAMMAALSDRGPYAPLGPYPVQTFERFDGAGVAVISGELCSADTVDVVLSLYWQAFRGGDAVEGAVVPVAAGIVQTRPAGCETFCDDPGCDNPAFRNPVLAAVCDLDRDMSGDVSWRVVGSEAPASGGAFAAIASTPIDVTHVC